MLTVTSFKKNTSKEGREYITLEIQGGLEMNQSSKTGRFYATVRKATISTTFGEAIARSLVGTQIKGTIVRVECEPYPYTIKDTGEEIMLMHTWQYRPEGAASVVEEPSF
jgi:hypothetical protein